MKQRRVALITAMKAADYVHVDVAEFFADPAEEEWADAKRPGLRRDRVCGAA